MAQPEGHPADDDGRKARLFFAVLLAIMAAIGGWVFLGHRARGEAARAVLALGGKAVDSTSEGMFLGPVSLAGRPVGDAELARLGPLFEAAKGPLRLDLSRTQVTDAGLAALAPLTYLAGLQLDGTRVAGPGLAALARMGTETHEEFGTPVELSLVGTGVGDEAMGHVAAIGGLTDLDLSGTRVTGRGLVALRRLRYLKHVELNGCAIGDGDLGALGGVYFLGLARTRVTAAGLGAVRHVRTLDLAGTAIDDAGMAVFAGFAELTGLSLAGTGVGDAGLMTLRRQERLVSLNLDGTGVNDESVRELAGWQSLRSLSLEQTAVTDKGLGYLAGLPNLDRLLLRGAKFTEAGVAALQKLRPNLLIDR